MGRLGNLFERDLGSYTFLGSLLWNTTEGELHILYDPAISILGTHLIQTVVHV